MPRRFVVLAVVAAVLAVSACTDDDSEPASPRPGQPPSDESEGAIAWTVHAAEVASAVSPAPAFPDDLMASVRATFDHYLNDAVLEPLRTGGPGRDLSPLFTATAAPRLQTSDHAAFFDEGLPKADTIRAEGAGLAFTALVAPTGDVQMVAVRMGLRLVAEAEGTPITIDRSGDFLLLAEGDGWKIDGYDVRVTRDTPDGVTTTTAQG